MTKKGAESNVNNNASTECKTCTKSKASKESNKRTKTTFMKTKQ